MADGPGENDLGEVTRSFTGVTMSILTLGLQRSGAASQVRSHKKGAAAGEGGDALAWRLIGDDNDYEG